MELLFDKDPFSLQQTVENIMEAEYNQDICRIFDEIEQDIANDVDKMKWSEEKVERWNKCLKLVELEWEFNGNHNNRRVDAHIDLPTNVSLQQYEPSISPNPSTPPTSPTPPPPPTSPTPPPPPETVAEPSIKRKRGRPRTGEKRLTNGKTRQKPVEKRVTKGKRGRPKKNTLTLNVPPYVSSMSSTPPPPPETVAKCETKRQRGRPKKTVTLDVSETTHQPDNTMTLTRPNQPN